MISLFTQDNLKSTTASVKTFSPLRDRMLAEQTNIEKRLSEIQFIIPNTHVLYRLLKTADSLSDKGVLEYISKSTQYASSLSRSLSLYSEMNRGKPRVGDFMGRNDLNYIYVDGFVTFNPNNLDSLINNYQQNKPLKIKYHNRNDLSNLLPLHRKYADVGVSSFTLKLDLLFITYLGFKRANPDTDITDYIRYLLVDTMRDTLSIAMVNRGQDQYVFKLLDDAQRFRTIPSRDYSKDFDKVSKKMIKPMRNKKGFSNVIARFPTLVNNNELLDMSEVHTNRYTVIMFVITVFPRLLFLLENESKINATRSNHYKDELRRYFKRLSISEIIETIPDNDLKEIYHNIHVELQKRL